MKQINFTVTAILPSLLDKSKTQTIRKAWKQEQIVDYEHTSDRVEWRIVGKRAKFKVGDVVELVWDRDSECEWFCKTCGCNCDYVGRIVMCKNDDITRECATVADSPHDEDSNMFNKHLGKVKITEVFQVEMKGNMLITYELNSTVPVILDWSLVEDFAKADGFKSSKEMFKYFDDNYDLSQPRRFWIYRWEWLE